LVKALSSRVSSIYTILGVEKSIYPEINTIHWGVISTLIEVAIYKFLLAEIPAYLLPLLIALLGKRPF
jgi:hypothetical protein